MKRVAVVSILAVAAAGGAGAWAAGLIHGNAPERSAVVTTKHLPAAAAPASRPTSKATLADSSPWRTGWALSLDHPGVTTGTDLSCRSS